MRAILHELRRAPGRVIASVLAIALAVGALGVLAIPTISRDALREAASRDGLADLMVSTSPLDGTTVERVAALPNVQAVEGQIDLGVQVDGHPVRLIGLDFANQQMDVVRVGAGRLPAAPDEIVVSPGLAQVGDVVTFEGQPFTVVGLGTTMWWATTDAAFAELDAVRAVAPEGGTNRLVISAVDDGADALADLEGGVRAALAADGDHFTSFPITLANGEVPGEADIRQVSTLIGMLGVVAGLVALVLLASTTSTLVTERTREVAVMRAMGGRARPLRRRLRSIAMVITVAGLAIGLPLGVAISNVISRMVLERFAGLTPPIGVDWKVLALSAAAMLIGARLVSARSARTVTKVPLAEALRDREGSPYGRTAWQRLLARLRLGGLSTRLATRAGAHHPGRTLALVAEVAAAVGAAFLIASLATSVNAYNDASRAPWSWASQTVADDAGLPLPTDVAASDPDAETGIWTWGEIGDWQVDVYGLDPATRFFDPMLADGRWIEAGARDVVVSAGFAERTGIAVGEALEVDLATGPETYRVSGIADDHARTLYLDRAVLADDLGQPGQANVVWSSDDEPAAALPVAATTTTAAELAEEDGAGRQAIIVIFGTIGAVVAGVAALAVTSSMTVSLYRRRHELATMQALGARRRTVRGVVVRELLPIGLVGLVLGLGLGALGTQGVIASFESSNAVDIGVVNAVGSIPVIAAATVIGLVVLAWAVVRTAARRPIAVTLRGAA